MPVRIEGLEELIKRIDTLQKFENAKIAVAAAGKYVKQKARLYPRKPNRPQPFKTDKSRRFFFWALRTGRITVPYKRTMALKRGWTSAVADEGLTAIVSNDVWYGPLVQGDGSQALYHSMTGWQTETQIKQAVSREVYNIIERGIQQDVNNG